MTRLRLHKFRARFRWRLIVVKAGKLGHTSSPIVPRYPAASEIVFERTLLNRLSLCFLGVPKGTKEFVVQARTVLAMERNENNRTKTVT